ncbi:PP2C family protein-serine/threonine phosphatase [Ruminococcus albus]|uniref:Protein phosphatase 2C n=1 Tax=Ruminococcus albus 8 TaxID=246199 RepID=E9SH05_RUMAL|nr:PP2C family serine/threonine-protein phosphatase [Ruminococcus albus]EGC01455.1 protein phosphatase 2C [Ruminococcus albus 8]MCC3351000.1 serine/threonine-protein phosphatase [Ruminococcus albus 8]
MKYYVYGYTNTGNRDKNEDAVLVGNEVVNDGFREAVLDAPFITGICDGVGGEKAGEVASRTCLQMLSEVEYTASSDLKSVVLDIHNKIKKVGSRSRSAENMQTTLCALAVDEEGRGLCLNVGDSRLYRFVNGTIRQISTDQSLGQLMYNKGAIDTAEELVPEYRAAIVSAIGSPHSEPNVEQVPLVSDFGAEPDDMVIITSDGISDYVSDNEFEVGLSMDLPISEKLAALAKLALLNGSNDNLSIIGIKPFLDFEELAALTSHDAVSETVNVMEMLEEQSAPRTAEEKDELSDILTIDLGDIIGKSKPEPKPEPHHEIVSREDIELETHDLFMQAQASLSRLSGMIPKKKKDD